MYYSVTSDADELDLITWHFGGSTVQLQVRNSECTADDANELFFVTCDFDSITSQLTSRLEVVNELTLEDDRKIVKFEAEGVIDSDGTKDKESKEVVITVKECTVPKPLTVVSNDARYDTVGNFTCLYGGELEKYVNSTGTKCGVNAVWDNNELFACLTVPFDVSIEIPNTPLKEIDPSTATCISKNSKPSADNFVFFIDGVPVKNSSVPRYENTAEIEFDRKIIKCKAENTLSSNENSNIQESYSEEIVIDILFSPRQNKSDTNKNMPVTCNFVEGSIGKCEFEFYSNPKAEYARIIDAENLESSLKSTFEENRTQTCEISTNSKATSSDAGNYTVEIVSTGFIEEKLYVDVEIVVREKEEDQNLGLIIGCSVGGFVLVIIVVVLCCKYRNKQPQPTIPTMNKAPQPTKRTVETPPIDGINQIYFTK